MHCSNLQNTHDDFSLVFSQKKVVANLAQTVDGVESDTLNLIIKHVNDAVLAQQGELGRVSSQLTEGIKGRIANI